ncbi:uncharacterized protein MYCFIDRAFT_34548 [Pseudocercospora fijiensis CIRAD86]|uniref:Aminotransferase class I/classII large domain-containing protein n=1 Tax=Pseudocercospora fijiensis (strain CIRAD86) TaxID=383855 RepID=M3ANP4_PSEFD|nr:uncharacterized protein MYCFIDRAFT_34548 [Pseudocercospora fijiensis CIRAD86]EME79087.1 hypothetical protein MYCFIDRAFT_34548 [Pseudocercospora fijiensis CIRAD86]
MLGGWASAQRLRSPTLPSNTPALYRGLEKALDEKRAHHGLVNLRRPVPGAADFSSNDALSLASTGQIRKAFFEELSRYPDFSLGSTGSRLLDGNNTYVEDIEQEVADFHRAETGLITNSGYEANGAIFTAIPQPGDVILYDELIHASVHDGMKHTKASSKLPFLHNDVDSFASTLRSVRDAHPRIRAGESTIFVAVETVYSMDGDVCPLAEMVATAKQIFPFTQTVQFIVDEAHSTGVIGRRGSGLVCLLGLEKEIAIRVHTFGKALGSHGAIVLANDTIRNTLINFARGVIYTTAPSFPMLAAIRAGYGLLNSGETQQAQDKIQKLIKHFFATMANSMTFARAEFLGMCSIPVMENWETKPFLSHIVPIWTKEKYNYYLMFHIQLAGYCAWAIDSPVVPEGTGRVRFVFHANNTLAEVDGLAQTILEFFSEMIELKSSKSTPRAAQKVYRYLSERNLGDGPTVNIQYSKPELVYAETGAVAAAM